MDLKIYSSTNDNPACNWFLNLEQSLFPEMLSAKVTKFFLLDTVLKDIKHICFELFLDVAGEVIS